MAQTSGTALMVFRMLIGNPPVMKTMKQCPQLSARAFFSASSMSSASFPVRRTRAGPLDSQNAMPNFIWGTVCTIASCRSSIVLMKCDWPRMTLTSAGLSIGTVVSSTAVSFALRPLSEGLVPGSGFSCISAARPTTEVETRRTRRRKAAVRFATFEVSAAQGHRQRSRRGSVDRYAPPSHEPPPARDLFDHRAVHLVGCPGRHNSTELFVRLPDGGRHHALDECFVKPLDHRNRCAPRRDYADPHRLQPVHAELH